MGIQFLSWITVKIVGIAEILTFSTPAPMVLVLVYITHYATAYLKCHNV